MIDRDHALPLAHQAQLLELSRGSLYYVPVLISEVDLELMRGSISGIWTTRSSGL